MSLITAIICAIFALLSLWHNKKTNNRYISLTFVFYCIWFLVSICSSVQLYGFEKPSFQATLLIFIMVLSFAVGSMLEKITRKTSVNKKEPKNPKLGGVFFLICGLCVVLNAIDSISVVKEAINGTPLWQIRNWTHEPFGSSNPILDNMTTIGYAVRILLVEPFGLIIPAVAAYYLFNYGTKNNKKTRIILLISIVNLAFTMIKGAGGRLGLLFYAVIFLVAFIASRRKTEKAIRKKTRTIILIVTAVLALIIISTAARTGFGNLFRQVYSYFALPPTLLSKWLPTINMSDHSYGLLTFHGIFGYPFRILLALGFSALVPNGYFLSRDYLLNAENYLQVGGKDFNAFVTPVYYFMYDGGVVFVLLMSAIFGFLISKFENRDNGSLRHFCFYSLVLYGVLVSFMRVQTSIPNYIISFILVYLIFVKIKTKRTGSVYEK